jgi:alkyl sulfatase BDS1-like metallo-beta-lactamase superfamily hydrolase
MVITPRCNPERQFISYIQEQFDMGTQGKKSDGPKDATKATKEANRRILDQLDFSDRKSFDDANRGFIAPLPDKGVVKNVKGDTVWNLPDFDFLAGDVPAPDTVNPSLWRVAQIMQRNVGLFKVTDGIYQVRGTDISNITMIEGKSGVIIMDPCMSEDVAKGALDLYYEHRPKKPVVAVITSHSHVDHYGGVLGVVSAEDLKSGKVKYYVPAGYADEALDEAVIGGNRQTRLSGYQYSMLVERGPKGNVTTGLGLDTSKGAVTFALPTDEITEDQTVNIDGLDFEFMLAPDTEAPAEMFGDSLLTVISLVRSSGGEASATRWVRRPVGAALSGKCDKDDGLRLARIGTIPRR